KSADIRDNLDISRIDDITERDIDRLNRYKAALKLLGA
ncbi:MAG: GTP pyrophosphokinase, partial [Rhodobacteraceae bacterium]|nr:GTP pyrophosphokinase [Paracoccaceae bacterium]